MNQQKHASQKELRDLIDSTTDSKEVHRIGEHVHQCPVCRKVLESMAAQSAIWRKASEWLQGSSKKSPRRERAVSSRTDREGDQEVNRVFDMESNNEADNEAEEATNEWQSQWPITDLLDRPVHPEMLGRIGKYDIEREIGRGGMGVVLKAHDAELNRPVAIKVLTPHLASHGTARKRFAQEAIAAGGILHPNVISVYGVNNEGKTPFIVMPFVSGASLQTLVDQNGPLTEIEIVRVAMQISSGLAAAHSQGLVHRDIKPANILVDGGVHRVMITDFGLARAADDASLTRTGWLMGTPNYMSPEQTRGQRADGRSDLFSLGSLMYFLASGRLPFRAESPLGVLHRIQHDQPTPVRQVNQQVSKTLAEVIEKLLKKVPQDRFQSAAELHDLLEKHLAWLHQPDVTKAPRVRSTVSNNWPPRLSIVASLFLTMSLTIFAIGHFRVLPISATFAGFGTKLPVQEAAVLSEKESGETLAEREHTDLLDQEEEQAGSGETFVGRSGEESDHDITGEALFCEADQLYNQERFEESLAGFEKATGYESVKAKSHYNIACIQVRKEQRDAAFDSLRRAVEFGFADLDHYRTDPDLEPLRNDKRFDELISRIRELGKADELLNRAKREANSNHLAAAEKLCREAVDLNPNNYDAITHLGYYIHLQGRIDEAFPWHERAANSTEFKALGNYNLACFHSLKGNSDEAIEHLNVAIRSGLSKCLSVRQVREDDDFVNIRDDERFSSALAVMREQEQMLKKGLDPALVEDYRAVGLDHNEFHDQIRKHIPASLVLDYRSASLEIEEHKTLLQNRVPVQLILRYRNAGLNIKEHQIDLLQRLEPSEAQARKIKQRKN